MATPSAAQHRDLEQRFRNIEGQLRRLAGAVATRPALTVAELNGPDGAEVRFTPDGDVDLAPAIGRTVVIGHTTTASGANCYIDTVGNIYRSTSSLRYKQDVSPAVVDTAAVLELQPREYRTRADVAELGDDAPTHVGFIAEEADALGLEPWVVRDPAGEPDAFNYAQWCVAQQAVIQQQQAALVALAARVDALEPDPAPQESEPDPPTL
jgi:hypothetical protein